MERDFTDFFVSDFFRKDFANSFKENFDTYIDAKLRLTPSFVALVIAFGENSLDVNAQARVNMIENNPYYVETFTAQMETLDTKNIWSGKKSAFVLASIAVNEGENAARRISAVKELNIMYGVTMVDSLGNTRAATSMDDFYASLATDKPAGLPEKTKLNS